MQYRWFLAKTPVFFSCPPPLCLSLVCSLVWLIVYPVRVAGTTVDRWSSMIVIVERFHRAFHE